MSLRTDWQLLAGLALPILGVLGALVVGFRTFIGTHHERMQALIEEEKFQAQRAYVRGLGPKLDEAIRQMYAREHSSALVRARRSKALEVLGADLRVRPDKGGVVELDLPESTVEMGEQELDALIRNAPFLDDLLDDPQAFRLLVRSPATLQQLREYLRLTSSRLQSH